MSTGMPISTYPMEPMGAVTYADPGYSVAGTPPMFIFIKQRGLNKSFYKSKTYLTPPMLKLFWKMCMLQVWRCMRCMVQCVGQ